MAPAIPDRWLNYKPIGERIEGTRFIAFKVPLREHIIQTVEEENRLDGKILLEKLPSLGMIIDLTNTKRYYDPNFFDREGVQHKKLMIPGHLTPPNNLVDKFKLYVMSFLNNNKDNDKLIGVHCTHGVNRTGYLICNYMISEMTMQPEEAIKRFDTARGHKIERENYLESLHNLTSELSQKSDTQTQTQIQIATDATTPTTYKAWRERQDKTDDERTIRHRREDHHQQHHQRERHYNNQRHTPYDRNNRHHSNTSHHIQNTGNSNDRYQANAGSRNNERTNIYNARGSESSYWPQIQNRLSSFGYSTNLHQNSSSKRNVVHNQSNSRDRSRSSNSRLTNRRDEDL